MRWRPWTGVALGALFLAGEAAVLGGAILARVVFLAIPWVLLIVSHAILRGGQPRGAVRPALLASIGGFLWMALGVGFAIRDGWNPLASWIPPDDGARWILGQAVVLLTAGFLLYREAERRTRDQDEAREDRLALRAHRATMGRTGPRGTVGLRTVRPASWRMKVDR